MDADAYLGYSCVGYQSPAAAFASCDVSGSVPVRWVGQTSKGRTGNRRELAQEGKVGYCPYPAAATRVALPPSFALGVGDALKAQCLHQLKDFDPWGGRRLAARKYNQANGQIPDGWGWAASALCISGPDPLSWDPAHANGRNSAIPNVEKAHLHPPADKKPGIVLLRGESSASAPLSSSRSVSEGYCKSRSVAEASVPICRIPAACRS